MLHDTRMPTRRRLSSLPLYQTPSLPSGSGDEPLDRDLQLRLRALIIRAAAAAHAAPAAAAPA